MLMKAIAVDTQAVQRHRATILECVKVTKYNLPDSCDVFVPLDPFFYKVKYAHHVQLWNNIHL
jgi:hypothetical protein